MIKDLDVKKQELQKIVDFMQGLSDDKLKSKSPKFSKIEIETSDDPSMMAKISPEDLERIKELKEMKGSGVERNERLIEDGLNPDLMNKKFNQDMDEELDDDMLEKLKKLYE